MIVWFGIQTALAAPDTVEVSSRAVARPVAVRYAWAANPEGANLVNSAGLPASVFRTDSWDDVEVKFDGAAQQASQHTLEPRKTIRRAHGYEAPMAGCPDAARKSYQDPRGKERWLGDW